MAVPYPTGLIQATQQRSDTARQRGFISAPENSFYLGANGKPDPYKPIAPSGGVVYGADMKPLWSANGTPTTATNPAATPPTATPKASATNPFSTISNVKNPEISSVLKGALGDLGTITDANRKSLNDYVTKAGQTQVQNQAATDAQTKMLGDLYNGKTAADQKALTDRFAITSQGAGDLAMSRAAADAAARGMASGSTGAGSYYAAQLGKQNAEIAIPLAQQVAQQRIADMNHLLALQTGNTGRAQSLSTAQQQSLLLPNEARNAFVDSTTRSLQPITALDQANTFYGLQGPEVPRFQLPFTTAPMPGSSGASFPRYTPTSGTRSTSGNPALERALQGLNQDDGYTSAGPGLTKFSGPIDPRVAAAYQQLTGKLPQQDPYFDKQAYQRALTATGTMGSVLSTMNSLPGMGYTERTPITSLDNSNPDLNTQDNEDFSTGNTQSETF